MVPNEYKILKPAQGFIIRSLCYNSDLLCSGPLYDFNLELSVIEIAVK